MRSAAVLATIGFLSAVGYTIAQRLGADAIATVVGVTCGVVATIPSTILFLLITRRRAQTVPPPPQAHQQPPVIIVTGGQPQAMSPPRLPGRQFDIIDWEEQPTAGGSDKPRVKIIGEPDEEEDWVRLPLRDDVWDDAPPGRPTDTAEARAPQTDLQTTAHFWDEVPPARRPDPPEDSHLEAAGADHARADRVGPGRVAQAEDPPELVEAARRLSLRQLRIQYGIGYSRAKRLKQTYDPTYAETQGAA